MKKTFITLACMLVVFFGFKLIVATPEADAKTITWRMQTTWPTGLALHDSAVDLANRISELSGGRLKIEVTPAGTMVPAFEVLDAVHRGVIDAAHGWSAYWIGKQPTANLFSSVAGGPFGMDNVDYAAWLYTGGGLEYYQQLYGEVLGMRVMVWPTDLIASEPLGWFKKPITSVGDLQGLKFRASGLTAEIYRELGMAVITLPGGEIVSALERGIIDGAEFMCPTTDKDLGFQDVVKYYHAPGMHRHTGTLEFMVNRAAFEKLPKDLQKIVELACLENLMRGWVTLVEKNVRDLEELRTKYNVKLVETPPEVITAILEAWDRVAARYVEKDPFFAEVYKSQKEFASRMVPYRRSFYVPYELAADYYWPRN